MSESTQYVAGFMFNADYTYVALIRKNKPAWQAGKLNGIGGKVEPGESVLDAIIREFREETGVETERDEWGYYCRILGSGFEVYFFVAGGDLSRLKSMEEDKIEIIYTRDIHVARNRDMIENLPWLIAMAIDHRQDGKPMFAEIHS